LRDKEQDIADVSMELVNSLDAARVIELLHQVKEPYRSAVTLFYIEDLSYNEMAGILEVPIGTVQSRISRGVGHLQRLMFRDGGKGQHRPSLGPGTAKFDFRMSPGTCTASELSAYENQDASIAQQDRGEEGFHNLVCKVRFRPATNSTERTSIDDFAHRTSNRKY
jgi:hypothetical protein